MEWFENEDFWRTFYGYMFSAERFAAAPDEVARILALTKCTGGSVLDLCCGPGRHSLEFTKAGFKVTGVDKSTFLLEKARQSAAEVGAAIEWVQQDMRDFLRPASFDLVCSMFTSFGYFKDPDEDLHVLRNIHQSLKDNGVLIIETLGKEYLARVWQSSMATDLADGSWIVHRTQVRDDWTRVFNRWTLLKDGHAKEFTFEHTIYSGRELKERLLAAGFKHVQLFGSLQGIPYGLEAQRLVAVARKTAPVNF
jgi:SAM-dependent methyltransferase